VALCSAAHPTLTGNRSNLLATPADLNETSLEEALIQIQGFRDERGLRIALTGRKLMIPKELQFVAERLMATQLRTNTADNDINAIRSMGMLPEGYTINQFFVDPQNWWIKTDCPEGFKYFNRVPISTKMDGDFETDNVRYRARERYSFGVSDWRCVFGSGNNAA
jgi:hypothetical protein